MSCNVLHARCYFSRITKCFWELVDFCGYPPVTKHSNWKSLMKIHGSSLTAAPMEGTWRKTSSEKWHGFGAWKNQGKPWNPLKSNGLSSCSYWNFGGHRLFSLIRSTRICPSAVELSEESDLIIRLTRISLVSKNNNKKIYNRNNTNNNNINYMYIQYTWYIISIIHKLQLMPLHFFHCHHWHLGPGKTSCFPPRLQWDIDSLAAKCGSQ